jgi:four helix bundle protein
MSGGSKEPEYDLEERTASFGEAIIDLAKQIPMNQITRSLIDQMVRSATGIGADYCKADDASSKKEFRQKIGYCRKEARETKHWIRMIVKAAPELRYQSAPLWQQAKELHLIFVAILRKSTFSDVGSSLDVLWTFVICH